ANRAAPRAPRRVRRRVLPAVPAGRDAHLVAEGRMLVGKNRVRLAAAAVVLLAAAGSAQAARVRYHYGVLDERGTTILRPINGSPGGRLNWTLRWEPYNLPPPRAPPTGTF